MQITNDHIQAILDNDARGIAKIYNAYRPRIVKYVVSNNGSAADGEDVFQEAIIVIFKQARKEDFQLTAQFYTYLFAICKRVWLKKLRQKGQYTEVTFGEDVEYIDESDLEALLEEELKHQLFRDKLRALGQQCQQLLRLFFRKTSMKEITEIMQFSSVNYTKKRKFKCKEQLTKLVREDDQFNALR